MLVNSREEAGFWCAVLAYMVSKTKQYGRRTYDMVCGKWKTVRPSVVWFCGVYSNVMYYQAETGTTFKLLHCWEILKDSPKWKQSELPKFTAESGRGSKRYKSSGSSSFNTESGEASINLNTNVGDNDEDEVQEIRRPMGKDKARDGAKKKGSRASGASESSSMNDDALARLMEYRQRQEDIRFYLQPYDHLNRDARLAMEELRAEIKANATGRDKARDAAKKKGSRAFGSSSMNDDALARLMEYLQCQEDIKFYLQPYDNLTRDVRLAMEELRAEIKAKYDLKY
ncbi:hypothetical protein Tco_1254997 [Tanacetum coccineum]